MSIPDPTTAADSCPDPRFDHRIVAEFVDLLERHGYTATELNDPDWAAIERELHELIYGYDCERGHDR